MANETDMVRSNGLQRVRIPDRERIVVWGISASKKCKIGGGKV